MEIQRICIHTVIYHDYEGFWYDLVGGTACLRGGKIHNSDKMLFEKSNQLFQVEHCKIYSKSILFHLEANAVQRMS